MPSSLAATNPFRLFSPSDEEQGGGDGEEVDQQLWATFLFNLKAKHRINCTWFSNFQAPPENLLLGSNNPPPPLSRAECFASPFVLQPISNAQNLTKILCSDLTTKNHRFLREKNSPVVGCFGSLFSDFMEDEEDDAVLKL